MKRKKTPSPAAQNISAPENREKIPARIFLLAASLFIGTIALYWPAHRCGFVYDDLKYILLNPRVTGGLTLANARWALTTGYASNWHPLTWLSHQFDVSLFGVNAGPMHDMNARVHAANAVLLFLFLLRATGATGRAAFVAALFAWHPLHVESVAWIAERKDLLAGFFGIASLWSYAEFAKNPPPKKSRALFYLGSLAALVLGLMCKPTLVTWPCVMLLLDWWPLRRFAREKIARLIFEKWPHLFFAVVSCGVTWIVQRGAMNPLSHLCFSQRAANALVAYATYLAKTFAPINLAVIYPHPGSWPAWRVSVSALLLVVISAAALRFSKRAPWLLFGWLWFLGTLVPAIGLVQVGLQAMADRYTYLPLVGIFIAMAWIFPAPVAAAWRKNFALTSLAICILLLGAVRMRLQLSFWQNGITLFQHALEVTGKNETAHYNLGIALAEAGRNREAIAEYRAALALDPRDAQAHNALGIALAGTGGIEEAIAEFAEALREEREYADAFFNLALAIAKTNNPQSEWEKIKNASLLSPEKIEALRLTIEKLRARGEKLDTRATLPFQKSLP